MLYAVNIGNNDFLCTGSYVVQGERYQVVGNYAAARKFKTYDAAKNWAVRLQGTRANVHQFSIINTQERFGGKKMEIKRVTKMDVNTFEVGDVIAFELNDGEKVEAIAVKQDGEDMIFCFSDCLDQEYCMNENGRTEGGYENCDLRAALNSEIIARFPEDIKSKLVAFENGDLLRIPTEKEIFGKNPYGKEEEPNEIEQWEPMKLRKNRIASQGLNGPYEWYWLQNVVSAASFASVNYCGLASCYNASTSHGVRPAFKISNP